MYPLPVRWRSSKRGGSDERRQSRTNCAKMGLPTTEEQVLQAALVDSHCHLDFDDFAEDRDAVLARARAAGVEHLLIAAVTPSHWARVQSLAAEHAGIWAAAGVHPNEDPATTPELDELLRALAAPRVAATGETGLDYFRSEGDLSWQRQRFALHIAAARQSGKPLIVHTRAAAADTLDLLRSEKARDVGGVIHCFTEDWDLPVRPWISVFTYPCRVSLPSRSRRSFSKSLKKSRPIACSSRPTLPIWHQYRRGVAAMNRLMWRTSPVSWQSCVVKNRKHWLPRPTPIFSDVFLRQEWRHECAGALLGYGVQCRNSAGGLRLRRLPQ
jgi:hypothetical protein